LILRLGPSSVIRKTPAMVLKSPKWTLYITLVLGLYALPDLSSPAPTAEPAAMQATGTDGFQPRDGKHISNRFAEHLPHEGDGKGRFLTAADGNTGSSPESSMGRKSLPVTGIDGSGRLLTGVHPAGLEPATLSSED
jgi:hypothetical protein